MIPILYESNENTYTSNGIGRLADAISCSVTEKSNGIYELNMVYPVTGELFSELSVERIILAKPGDTGQTQPFRIKKISKPLNGRVSVFCQHKSYDLNAMPVAPYNAVGIGASLTGLLTHCLVDCDYEVWTDIPNQSTPFTNASVQSVRACLGGTQGSILDTFRQIEYEWDRNVIKAHQYRGSDNGVSIRYGKNLTDIMHETSSESVYTGVLAQWVSEETCVYSDIQPTAFTSSTERIYILDASQDFDEQPTVEDLNNRALRFISNNSLDAPSVNITISFVALWQTDEYKNIAALERVSMGDTVHVFFTDYGINATAKVIGTVYDVLKERYSSVELGKAKASLSKTIKDTASSDLNAAVDSLTGSIRATNSAMAVMKNDMTSYITQAIAEASRVISGGTGGYVYISRNAEGQPNEIFLLDTPSVETAVNVLRINNAGIGGSTTGVNGTYNVAILLDGTINADAINAGTINGNLIRAGSILTSALQVEAQNAVSNVNTNFTFDGQGIHISTVDALYQTLVSSLGMRVMTTSGDATLIAEEDTVTANNLTANTYLRIVGTVATSRFQAYHDNVDNEDMVGCYWEVSN